MPELPEVEVLVRHLYPQLRNKKIRGVEVNRKRILGSTSERTFRERLRGATFKGLSRRGKYLLFELNRPSTDKSDNAPSQQSSRHATVPIFPPSQPPPLLLLGHLGHDWKDVPFATKGGTAKTRRGGF
jgi:hypothetical protein